MELWKNLCPVGLAVESDELGMDDRMAGRIYAGLNLWSNLFSIVVPNLEADRQAGRAMQTTTKIIASLENLATHPILATTPQKVVQLVEIHNTCDEGPSQDSCSQAATGSPHTAPPLACRSIRSDAC